MNYDGMVFKISDSGKIYIMFKLRDNDYRCFSLKDNVVRGLGVYTHTHIQKVINDGTWLFLYNIKDLTKEVCDEL